MSENQGDQKLSPQEGNTRPAIVEAEMSPEFLYALFQHEQMGTNCYASVLDARLRTRESGFVMLRSRDAETPIISRVVYQEAVNKLTGTSTRTQGQSQEVQPYDALLVPPNFIHNAKTLIQSIHKHENLAIGSIHVHTRQQQDHWRVTVAPSSADFDHWETVNGVVSGTIMGILAEDGIQRAKLLLWQANPRIPMGNEYQGLYGDEPLTTVLDFLDRSKIRHAILDFDMTKRQFDPNTLSQVARFATK